MDGINTIIKATVRLILTSKIMEDTTIHPKITHNKASTQTIITDGITPTPAT